MARSTVRPPERSAGAGEAPGQWLGAPSERLGLAGEISPEQLHLLFESQSPVDGAQFGSRRPSESRLAGLDLTFSAPKSVSLLYGLTTPEVATVVRRAHEAAVGDALSYMQRHATFARRGAGGARRIETTGLLAAGYQHRTSRSGDSQLHTHVLIANAVEGRDRRSSAPDARLFFFHGRSAGFVYQAALRSELAVNLGVTFAPVRNDSAKVDGVPGALVRLPDGRRFPLIEEAVDLLLASTEVVGLGVEGAGGEERSTTEDLLAVERRLLETASSGRGASVGVLGDQVIAGALLRRPLLADEQCRLVAEVAARGGAVTVVVGRAGAGKTTALDAVRQAYESAG